MSLHPDVQEFAGALRVWVAHLQTHEELFWAEKVAQSALEAERSAHYGVERFLGLFGGLGSLGNLLLQRDGQVLNSENAKLRVLIDRAYDMATALK